MPCKLRDVLFADAALARRIEGAECRLSLSIVDAVLARGGDAFAVPFGGGAAVFSGAGSPINKVIGVGFGEPASESVWDAVERRFAEKNCSVRVEISTLADSAIAAALTRRGYVLTDFENVLGYDLAGAAGAPQAPGDGLTIARNEGNLTTWMDLVVQGFAHPDGSPQSSEVFEDETLKQVFHDFAASAGLHPLSRAPAWDECWRGGPASLGRHRTVLWCVHAARVQAPRRPGGTAPLPPPRCRRGRRVTSPSSPRSPAPSRITTPSAKGSRSCMRARCW